MNIYRQIKLFGARYKRATGDVFRQASRDSARDAKLFMEDYAQRLSDNYRKDNDHGNNEVAMKILELPNEIEAVSVRSWLVLPLYNFQARLMYAADFEDNGDPLTSLTDLHVELKSCAGKRCIKTCNDKLVADEITSRHTLKPEIHHHLAKDLTRAVCKSIAFACTAKAPSPL